MLVQHCEHVGVDCPFARRLALMHPGAQRNAAVEELQRIFAAASPAAQVAAVFDDPVFDSFEQAICVRHL